MRLYQTHIVSLNKRKFYEGPKKFSTHIVAARMFPYENFKILFVDDEKELLEVYSDLYSHFKNIEIHTASSGNEALTKTLHEKFDVIISDVRMPDGDGVFLLHELKKRSLQMPLFYFATGFSDFTENDCVKWGAKGILKKPGHIEILNSLLPELKKQNEI